ncbi:hypothetical protein APPUASWS_015665 [Arthrospira platensis str. Paraca]|nr:hypothetical protein APPUASWS_015645 [Arthrospira platensis str. Paraca]KDR56664.1 hypothetical protein APPUASWS_015665 [Arthrospira platensis str. Paraca]
MLPGSRERGTKILVWGSTQFRPTKLWIGGRGAPGSDAPSTPAACQVSESPEVSTVARQFIEANPVPWQSSQEV